MLDEQPDNRYKFQDEKMKEIDILQRFIANNYEFERLESFLNEFNPLNVLKVDNYEIRHSNVLSWLLDPKENHKLGNTFIRKFLSEVIINNDNLKTNINVFNVQELSYSKIEIKREWNDIDIIIIDKENKIVVFIENKIYSSESKDQLKKYHKIIDDNFIGYEKIPVFLTLFGDNPSDDRYGTINYIKVLEIIRFIIEIQSDNLNGKIADFINYYLRTLELLTMENNELKELCKKIYKEHKVAIDLIWQYAEKNSFEEAANEFCEQKEFTNKFVNGRSLWVIPKIISENTKKVGEEKWAWSYPIAVWFSANDRKIGVILEVGPFLNGNLRVKFLEHIKKNGFTINERSLQPTARYTRIFSKYFAFDDWDEKESIVEKMDELYDKQLKKHLDNVNEACKSFNWEE
jgi:hypothetical protein